jgi:hypothetical protein
MKEMVLRSIMNKGSVAVLFLSMIYVLAYLE